jgi:hypothetical protein
MRSLAIHSTIDLALISLSCSRGTSYSDVSAISRIPPPKKTHVFDTLHIINVSPLVILPPRTRACTREQSRVSIVPDTDIIAVEEVWRAAAVGRAHTTAASALHAVSLPHLGFGCTACGGRQRLKVLGVIQTRIRVCIEPRMFRIVAVARWRVKMRMTEEGRTYSSMPGPKRSSPSSSSSSTPITSCTASRSSALSPSVSENGGGGEEGGSEESRRESGWGVGEDELAGRPGDLARFL